MIGNYILTNTGVTDLNFIDGITILAGESLLLWNDNNILGSKSSEVLKLISNDTTFNFYISNGQLVFKIDDVVKTPSVFYQWISHDIVVYLKDYVWLDNNEILDDAANSRLIIKKTDGTIYTLSYATASSNSYITGNVEFDFGQEENTVVVTVPNLNLTNTNIKNIIFIPQETSETSLDEFMVNGLQFNIENIVDNVSFDLRATAINDASGIHTVKYSITY